MTNNKFIITFGDKSKISIDSDLIRRFDYSKNKVGITVDVTYNRMHQLQRMSNRLPIDLFEGMECVRKIHNDKSICQIDFNNKTYTIDKKLSECVDMKPVELIKGYAELHLTIDIA